MSSMLPAGLRHYHICDPYRQYVYAQIVSWTATSMTILSNSLKMWSRTVSLPVRIALLLYFGWLASVRAQVAIEGYIAFVPVFGLV